MVRLLSACLRRTTLRCISSIKGQSLPRQYQPIFQLKHTRSLHDETPKPAESESAASEPLDPKPTEPENQESEKSEDTQSSENSENSEHKEAKDSENMPVDPSRKWETYRTNFIDLNKYRATPSIGFKEGLKVTVRGFIGKRKDVSSNLSFCELSDADDPDRKIQIVSTWEEEGSPQFIAHQDLKTIPAYSPVIAVGTLGLPPDHVKTRKAPSRWDLKLRFVNCLNPFPKDIIVSKDAVWPPHQRHLQLRFDPLLRERLRLRSMLQPVVAKYLQSTKFLEIDTPLLFKSTPEGAREFLVPTRRQGYAYALPQSPQQYKQILMASGITRYYQWAKCFRDEDHRADRQPEFTQLDLEMAFSSAADCMKVVSKILDKIFLHLSERWSPIEINGIQHPKHVGLDPAVLSINSRKKLPRDGIQRYPRVAFTDMGYKTYDQAMKQCGTDKPDLRVKLPYMTLIRDAKKINPPESFINKITSLKGRVTVDMIKLRLGLPPKAAGDFIRKFMDSLPVKLSPESTPAVLVYDSSKPLNGLSVLGHEAAENLEEYTKSKANEFPPCKDGDILIFQARKRGPFYGGSTDMGRLRKAVYDAGVEQGHIPRDHSFKVIWIHEFPLFTPNEYTADPGQGGRAGISSTHHPFTAPLTDNDFFNAQKNPLQAKGDHYDLVINGVEIGGGSRRIHAAKHQDWILREVLKMTDEGMAEFSHLLEALRAGCPPHAGFAFGFDRLLTVLCNVPSVKDVIAFPKNNRGEDLMVRSPGLITAEQRKTYHIFQDSDSETTVQPE
ncbi:tRNA synthetases class II-domain-containing protein [Daldinia sp. FL1419]|nr:tRNA synthetases class II-domain-containing protein [Daldinia sp. FL1419]